MSNLSSLNKKSTRKEVEKSLVRLEFLKAWLGEKKFEKRIKKAARMLTTNLPKSPKNKQAKTDPVGEGIISEW